MVPSAELYRGMIDAMAADTAFLAAATAMHVHPVVSNFIPAPDLVLADLDLATFTGGAAKTAGTGVQPVFNDPAVNRLSIRIKEPAGGWAWTCTATPAAPEIVYGCLITDTADAVILGSFLLAAAVTITAEDDGFSVGDILLTFIPGSPY